LLPLLCRLEAHPTSIFFFGLRELATALYRLEAHSTSIFFFGLRELATALCRLDAYPTSIFFFGLRELATALYRLEAHSTSIFFFGLRELATALYRLEAYPTSIFFFGLRELATALKHFPWIMHLQVMQYFLYIPEVFSKINRHKDDRTDRTASHNYTCMVIIDTRKVKSNYFTPGVGKQIFLIQSDIFQIVTCACDYSIREPAFVINFAPRDILDRSNAEIISTVPWYVHCDSPHLVQKADLLRSSITLVVDIKPVPEY
jgi:hypothetical protein